MKKRWLPRPPDRVSPTEPWELGGEEDVRPAKEGHPQGIMGCLPPSSFPPPACWGAPKMP